MLFSPRPCAKRMQRHARGRPPRATQHRGRDKAAGRIPRPARACRQPYSAVPFVASMDSLTSRSSSCFVKPLSSTGMSMRYEFSVAFTCGERFA